MLDVVDSLPRCLVEYAEEVQDEGGIQSLHDMLQKVQNMSRKISSMIEEGFNILEEENENDVILGRKFGKRKSIDLCLTVITKLFKDSVESTLLPHYEPKPINTWYAI